LLVDDEIVQIRGLIKFINWHEIGFDPPDSCCSAKTAMEKITTTPYDVVVTDVTMPEMSGLEMISKLKGKMRGMPRFVIVSGYDEFAYAQEALKLGVRFYVLKPVKVDEIEDVLRTVVMELTSSAIFSRGDSPMLPEKVHPLVYQVMLHINRECEGDLSAQALSKKFFINPSYLSALFKKEMNMNLSVYITKIRMKKALEYITAGTHKISEIAEMTGYQTPAYFSEQFKKEYGCTPKDYRC
jgi:YesN/AraC family two-component response regulator